MQKEEVSKKQVLEDLLERVNERKPIIIVGLEQKEIPTLHNFYPKKYYESIRHLGFGFFEGRTEHGKFSFDGGGAMRHYDFKEEGWLSWSPLRTDNAEVTKDLGYDFERVKQALREILSGLSS